MRSRSAAPAEEAIAEPAAEPQPGDVAPGTGAGDQHHPSGEEQ
jgi:hypothetical protein